MKRFVRRVVSDRSRGQGLVEFVVALPLIVVLMLGLFDAGRVVINYSTLTNATRAGARVAIVNQSNDATCTSVRTFKCAAAEHSVGMGISAAAVPNLVVTGSDCAILGGCTDHGDHEPAGRPRHADHRGAHGPLQLDRVDDDAGRAHVREPVMAASVTGVRIPRPERGNQRGQVLPLFVIGSLTMIAMVALVVDGGNAYAQKRMTQNGTDAAAQAGATAIAQGLGGAPMTDADVLDAIEDSATAMQVQVTGAEYTDIGGDRSGRRSDPSAAQRHLLAPLAWP